MQDIAVIGLAVMGQNLALNIAEKGFTVSVFNRTASKVQEFLEGPAKGFAIHGYSDLRSVVATLKKPRKLILMVKAGPAIDEIIDQLCPLLDPGDIIIDGGNSHFPDTERRVAKLEKEKLLFLGTGISGGEEGARHGPSIMPGGSSDAWPHLRPIFQSICAWVDGIPCCDWVGPGGAGHYVKMVHNGIEYADMQLICEAYDLLRRGIGCSYEDLANIFTKWNQGKLNSYLIEITSQILAKKDEDGTPLLEKVVDVAGQKGTGKWSVDSALSLGIPLSLVAEAVFSRLLSGMSHERAESAKVFGNELKKVKISQRTLIRRLEKGLYAAKIISYAQGFLLMSHASKAYGWNLDLASCALMWRGGCIIRSAFLKDIAGGYLRSNELLLLHPFFHSALQESIDDLRYVVTVATQLGIPISCFATALMWYDALRSHRLPTNLLQAQRDFFGAHLFERTDRAKGEMFHADWHA